MRNRNILKNFFIYLSLFFIIFPVVILILWSIAGRWSFPNIFPETFSTRAIEELFGGYSGAIKVLLNSVLISCIVAIISVIISIPAARAITMYNFYGKNIFKFVILMPIIVPATAFGMGIQIFFIKMGINDTVIGVILVHIIVCIPYTMKIISEVTEAVGNKLEIQARVLGASPLKAFINITIPILMPGIISSFSMAFIISFSQYFLTFIIGGGRVVTFSMIMLPYIQSGDRTIASAYGVIFIIATLGIFILFEKLTKKYYDIENTYFFG